MFRDVNYLQRFLGKLPLQTVFIVPFVLQIVGTVGLVGYLSYRNGERAVQNLANQLIEQVGERVQDNLNVFVKKPADILQHHQDLITAGVLNLTDMNAWVPYLWREYNNTEDNSVSAIFIANQKDEYRAAGGIFTKRGKLKSAWVFLEKRLIFNFKVIQI